MEAQARLRATYAIWTAFFLGLLVVNANAIFNNAELSWVNMVLSIVVALSAVGSTAFVWGFGAAGQAGAGQAAGVNQQQGQVEKQKRLSRADALMEMLDEDTLEALRQRLEARDDHPQQVPLDALLDEDGEIRRSGR